MRAVILAGGKGTRLRPYTLVLPKPLVPIGDYPILEVVIRQLAASGFTHVTMAVNHLAELVEAFFGDGRRWGLKIDYSVECRPLSTMAPLKLIRDLPDDFLVMNGDILTDAPFERLYQEHVAGGNLFTISSYQREVHVDFGVLETDGNGLLRGFQEKPVQRHDVSMGVYVLSRRVLEHIPDDVPFGFDDLMLALLGKGEKVHLRGHEGYWLDIGRPDDYVEAVEQFERQKHAFLRQ
ncbi:MAG: sugar phosphate nucleotidyltransferase [Candidatus Sericytochromatia bacterium]|nr:sugar phosphate nucleotidyltransferase [Candidatus Sericytochromatia bacterium]